MTFPILTRLFTLPLVHLLPSRWGQTGRAIPGNTDRLATMPAERLTDMGIPAQTEANRRNSWETGTVPKADLW